MDQMRRQIRIAALILAFGPILGCEAPKADVKLPEPPKVNVSSAVSDEITDHEDFIGRTDAVYNIDVRARVTGYLDKVYFQDGTEVKEGDLLFEIDPRPYQAELNRAEATVLQSEARQNRLDADHRRATSLFNRGALSREEFDKVSGDFAEADAAVGIARANRDLAQLNLGYTKVTAPISGRLSRRVVDPGNLVKADETVLTNIVSLDPVYVYFDLDERTLLRLRRLVKEGKIKTREEAAVPVLVALADEEEFPHDGTINFSDNKVDPNTGTLRVRGSIDNPKIRALSTRVFSPGMFVRVRLQIGAPHRAVFIPEQAIGSEQGQKFVFVVKKEPREKKQGAPKELVSVARKRVVKVGHSKGTGEHRVIEVDLMPGEQVIVSGLQRVRDDPLHGFPVQPVEEQSAEPATAPSTALMGEAGKGTASPTTGE